MRVLGTILEVSKVSVRPTDQIIHTASGWETSVCLTRPTYCHGKVFGQFMAGDQLENSTMVTADFVPYGQPPKPETESAN